MKKTFLIMFSLIVSFNSIVGLNSSNEKNSNKKIAVTIDDLPLQRIGHFGNAKSAIIFNRLLSSIKKQNAPVIGFVNEDKLEIDGKQDSRKIALLESWLNAGFDLGNHTYSHKSANEIPVNVFENDILKGERVIKPLTEAKGKSLKYFRHPFLQTGRSMETKNEIETFLYEHGYQIAPVTIDNSEWIFASAYDKAIDSNKTEVVKSIGQEYIKYMKQKLEYWENQTQALFGKEINHILLIHANTLNAIYYNQLCEMMIGMDYELISLEEALTDQVYKTKDTFTSRGGISWIHRWAITAGKPKEFFAGEPIAPKWICDYAGVDQE